jgi:NADH-quinone oxidoreductase subunit J
VELADAIMIHPLWLDIGSPSAWSIVVTLVVAAVAVYLLLPRPQPYPVLWGAAAGSVGLLLVLFALLSWGPFSVENVLFFLFAASAVGFGTLLVTQHDPARAALSFAMVVLSTCGLYLLQAAPFLMAATIIIYAGAIIVTFLFVLMLSQQHGLSSADYRSREALLSTVAGFVLLGSLLYVLRVNYDTSKLDSLVARLNQTAEKDLPGLLGSTDYIDELKQAAHRARPDLKAEIDLDIDEANKVSKYMPGAEKEFEQAVEKLKRELPKIRATTGDLQPKKLTSPFSNPNQKTKISGDFEVARTPEGVAPLPAENVVALGKSLFTDYLLSVELGGTLLLVATIGAIAITHRRGERSI